MQSQFEMWFGYFGHCFHLTIHIVLFLEDCLIKEEIVKTTTLTLVLILSQKSSQGILLENFPLSWHIVTAN